MQIRSRRRTKLDHWGLGSNDVEETANNNGVEQGYNSSGYGLIGSGGVFNGCAAGESVVVGLGLYG